MLTQNLAFEETLDPVYTCCCNESVCNTKLGYFDESTVSTTAERVFTSVTDHESGPTTFDVRLFTADSLTTVNLEDTTLDNATCKSNHGRSLVN